MILMYNIYLVDDEKNLNDILAFYLENEGYKVKCFTSGIEASKAIKDKPDIWILDIMIPDMDGFELLNKIKEDQNDMPVIFISARDQNLDKVLGLQMGCDDYIAKPFLPMELVIRTRNLLNRLYKNTKKTDNFIIDGIYKINKEKRIIADSNNIINLTSKEFDFILMLIENKNLALSREQIINYLYGQDYFGSDRTIDDLVRRVRKKLPKINIETIYGYGYRWCGFED
ncbi:MAG: response regulator transcription factor [Peptostreptococcaceae bacterium]|nr:response regulator transcription factor [Peptostreptococcaceae bacterium]